MAFHSHYLNTDPRSLSRFRWLRWNMPVLCLLGGLVLWLRSGGHWMFFVWFGAIALLWLAIYPWWHRMAVKNLSKQFDGPGNENLFGRCTMELNDERVVVTTDKAQETMLWSIFVRASETADHFFLFIARQQAVVVPKRALSAAEVEELRTLLKEHNLL